MNYSKCCLEYYRRCYAINLSKETIGIYKKVLNRLEKTLIKERIGTNGDDIEIKDITSNILRYHLAMLHESMQPITVRIHYRSLHSFFAFLEREEIIKVNVMDKVEKIKVPKREIQAFSKEDISRLLNVFDKDTFTGYRNYTITCLLFSTGMRRGEAVKLLMNDIHFDINIIKVIGKGNKFRNVPMGDSLRRVLIKYIKIRKEYIKEKGFCNTPALFISSITGCKLSVETLTEIYYTVGKSEGMKGVRVSPHTFRHTFAKYFLLNGGDIFSLQKILGHAEITTTKQYVNLNIKDIKMQNDKYNPLDNESWRFS